MVFDESIAPRLRSLRGGGRASTRRQRIAAIAAGAGRLQLVGAMLEAAIGAAGDQSLGMAITFRLRPTAGVGGNAAATWQTAMSIAGDRYNRRCAKDQVEQPGARHSRRCAANAPARADRR